MEFGKVTNGSKMLVKGHPCNIVNVDRSAPGKHGHAKKRLTGIDLFTNKKYEDVITHHSHLTEVECQKVTYNGLDMDDGYLSLMNMTMSAFYFGDTLHARTTSTLSVMLRNKSFIVLLFPISKSVCPATTIAFLGKMASLPLCVSLLYFMSASSIYSLTSISFYSSSSSLS